MIKTYTTTVVILSKVKRLLFLHQTLWSPILHLPRRAYLRVLGVWDQPRLQAIHSTGSGAVGCAISDQSSHKASQLVFPGAIFTLEHFSGASF